MNPIDPQHLQQISLQQLHQQQLNNDNLLMIRDANYWIGEARSRAIPQMLFGKFWHQETRILLLYNLLTAGIAGMMMGRKIENNYKTRKPCSIKNKAFV